jgi:hypothetical protein
MENPKYVRTAAQALAQQKADHAKPKQPVPKPKQPDPKPTTTAIVPVDESDPLARYLATVDDGPAGRLVKFAPKTNTYVAIDSGEEIDTSVGYAALCDQLMAGWIRFREGEEPQKIMGVIADGFMPPEREQLGDLDKSEWPDGLDGEKADPWREQLLLPLQNVETAEVVVFSALTPTSRNAVNRLLRHYQRVRRAHPDELLVVHLRTSGFQHKLKQVGWVPVPAFHVTGRIKQDGTPVTAPSVADDLDDRIRF